MTKRKLMGRINRFVNKAVRATGIHPLTGGRRFARVGWGSLIRYLHTQPIPPHVLTLVARSQTAWTVEAFVVGMKAPPPSLNALVGCARDRLFSCDSRSWQRGGLDSVQARSSLSEESTRVRMIDTAAVQDLIDALFAGPGKAGVPPLPEP